VVAAFEQLLYEIRRPCLQNRSNSMDASEDSLLERTTCALTVGEMHSARDCMSNRWGNYEFKLINSLHIVKARLLNSITQSLDGLGWKNMLNRLLGQLLRGLEQSSSQ